MAYSFLDWTLAPILRKRINVFKGAENIPQDNKFILAANHLSTGDSLFVVAGILPIIKQKIYFIAWENVWQVYGRFIAQRLLGMIPMSEDNKADCLQKAKQILLDNKPVGIFPEGTLQKDGLIKAKTGMVRLALWTKVPVLPVGVKCHVEWSMGPKSFLKVIRSKQPVEIRIGRPITFDDLYDKEVNKEILEKATRRVMKKIAELLGEEYNH